MTMTGYRAYGRARWRSRSPLKKGGLGCRHACLFPALMLLAATVPSHSQEREGPRTAAQMLQVQWSRGLAEGRGPIKLTTFPLRLEDLGRVRPMGMMASGHVTPSDHLYLIPKEPRTKDQRFDVLAVADGHLVMLQWRPNPPGGQPDPTVFDRAVDIKVVIEHAATCWSYVDHLTEVDPALLKQMGREIRPGQPIHVRVPVRAGQVIGKIGFQTLDFALIDTTTVRKRFVDPRQFLARDPWKLHTADPFDYVAGPLRAKLLALNPRKVKPFGGQIDYDIDGRLVGNWYRVGTGGYAGPRYRLDYWVGHLTIAYHHIAPAQVIVSLGDFEGRPRQFQVRGNGPDPAKVTKKVVKYELVVPTLDNGTGKPLENFQERQVGVLLVQVLDQRQLRVELFPGKTAAEIPGFTSAALLYER